MQAAGSWGRGSSSAKLHVFTSQMPMVLYRSDKHSLTTVTLVIWFAVIMSHLSTVGKDGPS